MSLDLYAERPLDSKQLEAEYDARKAVWAKAVEQPLEPKAAESKGAGAKPIDLARVKTKWIACTPANLAAVTKAAWPAPDEGYILLAELAHPTTDGRVCWTYAFSDAEVEWYTKRLAGIAEVGPAKDTDAEVKR